MGGSAMGAVPVAMEAAAYDAGGGARVAKIGDKCQAKYKNKWYDHRVRARARARVAKIGDKCQAKYKNKWYKARVQQVMDGGKKYKISFLDFKYVPIVRAADIRFT